MFHGNASHLLMIYYVLGMELLFHSHENFYVRLHLCYFILMINHRASN